MKKILLIVGVIVVAIAAYVGYRYWQIQSLAKKYATASEIASASLQKEGSTWTIRIESVIADPIEGVWKALSAPERSAELVPDSFKHSTLTKQEGNKKSLELELSLLSLPSQKMLAEMTLDEGNHRIDIDTSKGLQDINGRYQLSALSPERTLLVFSGTAVEKVALPVPQSVIEGALRELFVVQVKAIQVAIHGKKSAGEHLTAEAAPAKEAVKFCAAPPGPNATKQVTVTVAPAGEATPPSGPAEFRNESAQGYERGYVIDGISVREVFRVDTTCTTATATVGTLTVQVQSVSLRPETLEAWVRQVELKTISGFTPSGDEAADRRKLVKLFPPASRGWQIAPPDVPATLASPIAYQVYEQQLF